MVHEVRAPIAGKVIDLPVERGTPVEEGDDLAVIESMKMEIPVGAPAAGTVQMVHVTVGATVQEGDLLVTLEPV